MSIEDQYGCVKQLGPVGNLSASHLAYVDAIVDRPGRLEAFHHALLEGFGQPVHPYEVLQVLGPGVIEIAA